VVSVTSYLDEDVHALSIAGAAGFVGLGAAVVVVSDTSTNEAMIANNASVGDASSVNVSALTHQTLTAETGAATFGAVGAGASFNRLGVSGDTLAKIGDNAQIGQGGNTVGNVSVSAQATVDAHATTFGIAAGAIAVSANFAFVDVSPDVTASIGNGVHMTATGNVSVAADGELDLNAE
jgi:hypothetical protein